VVAAGHNSNGPYISIFFLNKKSPEGSGSITLSISGDSTNYYKGPHENRNNTWVPDICRKDLPEKSNIANMSSSITTVEPEIWTTAIKDEHGDETTCLQSDVECGSQSRKGPHRGGYFAGAFGRLKDRSSKDLGCRTALTCRQGGARRRGLPTPAMLDR
jgi:hypothetical protein